MFDNVPKNDQFLNQIIIMELNIIVLIFGILIICCVLVVEFVETTKVLARDVVPV